MQLALLLFQRCDKQADGLLSLEQLLAWYRGMVDAWPQLGGYPLHDREAPALPEAAGHSRELQVARRAWAELDAAGGGGGALEPEKLLEITETVWEETKGGGEAISDAEYVALTDSLLRGRRRALGGKMDFADFAAWFGTVEAELARVRAVRLKQHSAAMAGRQRALSPPGRLIALSPGQLRFASPPPGAPPHVVGLPTAPGSPRVFSPALPNTLGVVTSPPLYYTAAAPSLVPRSAPEPAVTPTPAAPLPPPTPPAARCRTPCRRPALTACPVPLQARAAASPGCLGFTSPSRPPSGARPHASPAAAQRPAAASPLGAISPAPRYVMLMPGGGGASPMYSYAAAPPVVRLPSPPPDPSARPPPAPLSAARASPAPRPPSPAPAFSAPRPNLSPSPLRPKDPAAAAGPGPAQHPHRAFLPNLLPNPPPSDPHSPRLPPSPQPAPGWGPNPSLQRPPARSPQPSRPPAARTASPRHRPDGVTLPYGGALSSPRRPPANLGGVGVSFGRLGDGQGLGGVYALRVAPDGSRPARPPGPSPSAPPRAGPAQPRAGVV